MQINMETAMQNVYLNIPLTDVKFFKELAKKMGWTARTEEEFLEKYIDDRPSQVDLSDDDIMAELKAVRYEK